MKDPGLVRAMCESLVAAVAHRGVNLSVKCRNGVDDVDSYEDLKKFIGMASSTGIEDFVIHSRKALLGLRTRQNFSVPPINYEYAYQLIKDFPECRFVINGEIQTAEHVPVHLANGVRTLWFSMMFD